MWRRSPPGFTKVVLDVWAEQFAKFLRSYVPEEAKRLSLEGSKVHLSPTGLLTLLRANVHAIAEPCQMAHILQALDTLSALQRYKPKARSRVREIALESHDAGIQLKTPELMICIAQAVSDALTEDALRTAFWPVGMRPLDPTVVSLEELCKRADAPVTSFNLERLTSCLIPVARKDSVRPMVVNGTILNATDVFCRFD